MIFWFMVIFSHQCLDLRPLGSCAAPNATNTRVGLQLWKYLEVLFCEQVVLSTALVDDLSDADDLSVVVADGHAHQRVRLVAGLAVDLTVKPRILKIIKFE